MPTYCQENYPQLEATGILLLFFHFTHQNAFWLYSIRPIHKKSKERGGKDYMKGLQDALKGFL